MGALAILLVPAVKARAVRQVTPTARGKVLSQTKEAGGKGMDQPLLPVSHQRTKHGLLVVFKVWARPAPDKMHTTRG